MSCVWKVLVFIDDLIDPKDEDYPSIPNSAFEYKLFFERNINRSPCSLVVERMPCKHLARVRFSSRALDTCPIYYGPIAQLVRAFGC